jgi:ABC-2 type transport system ATP-binding protein
VVNIPPSSSPAPAVVVEDLTVVRGGRTVLHGISTTIQAGTVTGLLGPSGGGKTTLMRAVVGVQRVASGRVTVLGLPAGSPPLRDRVGYVTQAPSVYADLTVRENLRYFAAVLGAPATDVTRVIEDVDLGDHADVLCGRLSGGQLARASLAVALLDAPQLLVLDEPTVGLDPVLRRDLWSMFRRLADDGHTLLVSSHVMDEASRCDRLMLIREGRLLADDTLDRVLASTGAADVEDAFLRLVDAAAAREQVTR